MADQRDPRLLALFAEARQDLDEEAFVTGVMDVARGRRIRLAATGLAMAMLLVIVAWLFSDPLLEFVQLVTRGLATPLVHLGDGWLGWMFAPVNNVGSLLVLGFKATLVFRKKMLSFS